VQIGHVLPPRRQHLPVKVSQVELLCATTGRLASRLTYTSFLGISLRRTQKAYGCPPVDRRAGRWCRSWRVVSPPRKSRHATRAREDVFDRRESGRPTPPRSGTVRARRSGTVRPRRWRLPKSSDAPEFSPCNGSVSSRADSLTRPAATIGRRESFHLGACAKPV